MTYKVRIAQEIKHEPVREGDKGWTSHEEIEGFTTVFEDVTAIIGLATQFFPNAEITVITDTKEDE